MPSKPVYYSVRDISDYYGVSKPTVWRWIQERAIFAKKRNLAGESRRVWCVTVAEFNKIGSLMAWHESRMAPGIRRINRERSEKYRKGLESE